MSKSQIDSMSQSMIEQTLNTEQSNTDSNQQPIPSADAALDNQKTYEQSVTEKENLLMSGFNKLNLNGNNNGLNNNLIETNNNLNLLNGKGGGDADLIMGDATNGHDKNNSIESAL